MRIFIYCRIQPLFSYIENNASTVIPSECSLVKLLGRAVICNPRNIVNCTPVQEDTACQLKRFKYLTEILVFIKQFAFNDLIIVFRDDKQSS